MSQEEQFELEIIIDNLPLESSEIEVRETFESYGKISQISIQENPSKETCVCVVRFESKDEAKNAILKGNGVLFKEVQLDVKQNQNGDGNVVASLEEEKPQETKPKAEQQPVIVKNIPSGIDENHILRLFSKFEDESIKVSFQNAQENEEERTCLIIFQNSENAQRAQSELNDMPISRSSILGTEEEEGEEQDHIRLKINLTKLYYTDDFTNTEGVHSNYERPNEPSFDDFQQPPQDFDRRPPHDTNEQQPQQYQGYNEGTVEYNRGWHKQPPPQQQPPLPYYNNNGDYGYQGGGYFPHHRLPPSPHIYHSHPRERIQDSYGGSGGGSGGGGYEKKIDQSSSTTSSERFPLPPLPPLPRRLPPPPNTFHHHHHHPPRHHPQPQPQPHPSRSSYTEYSSAPPVMRGDGENTYHHHHHHQHQNYGRPPPPPQDGRHHYHHPPPRYHHQPVMVIYSKPPLHPPPPPPPPPQTSGGRPNIVNPNRMHPNLFIFHLPQSVDDNRLYQIFAPFGDVISVKVVRDSHSGASKGYGFVLYRKYEEALTAIRFMDGAKIENKYLKVSFKTERGEMGGKGRKKRQR